MASSGPAHRYTWERPPWLNPQVIEARLSELAAVNAEIKQLEQRRRDLSARRREIQRLIASYSIIRNNERNHE